MIAIYLHDWAESQFDGMAKNFSDDLSYVDVLLASYTYENYSGDAFVLFRDMRDGLLYEVNGSHCSCYDLEGQWEPSLAYADVLRKRLDKGSFGLDEWNSDNVFATELRAVLDRLEKQ